MSQDLYQKMLLDRAGKSTRWEDQLVPEYTLDDLDHNAILKTVRLGKEAGRIPEDTSDNIAEILDRLELRENGILKNAAMALFGNNIKAYPQFYVQLARFKGRDKSEFLDEKQLKCHAFKILEETELFWDRHIPIAKRIPEDSFYREDKPLYPRRALREALANAICHRDYTIIGGSIWIAIFDDRVEISSNGGLPDGISISDLKIAYKSVLRNPIIARTFYRRGLIEQWSRGTQQIVKLCVEAGLPEPRYEEITNSVFVSLYSDNLPEFPSSLSEVQREVLGIIYRDGSMRVSDISESLSSSFHIRTIQRAISDLIDKGLVETIGHGKKSHYRYKT